MSDDEGGVMIDGLLGDNRSRKPSGGFRHEAGVRTPAADMRSKLSVPTVNQPAPAPSVYRGVARKESVYVTLPGVAHNERPK